MNMMNKIIIDNDIIAMLKNILLRFNKSKSNIY